jgi:hypothetical protein
MKRKMFFPAGVDQPNQIELVDENFSSVMRSRHRDGASCLYVFPPNAHAHLA